MSTFADLIGSFIGAKNWSKQQQNWASLGTGCCNDTCWTVGCWTAITRCVNYVVTLMFHTYGGMNRSLWTDPGAKHLFRTYGWIWTLKWKVLALSNWWQGRIPVEWVLILRSLGLPITLLWRTCCLEWWDECKLVGDLSTILSDSLEDLSVQRMWLKISGMYIFPVLQLRAGLLSLIWMASLDSLATCFVVSVHYLEVGGVCLGVVFGNVYVNCTGDMPTVFFYLIFLTSAGFSYVWKAEILFWEEHL